ncbi:MAG: HAD family hydrolase, partial [Planctomycetota bacterium]
MKAILFGSIGVITETSELQRESFNDAFAANGLNWHWEQDEYASMLEQSGGYNRIQRYANQVEAEVNSLALHQSKSKFFQTKLATETLLPRPGVVETILAAKKNGYQVALVTTTSAKNIGELL